MLSSSVLASIAGGRNFDLRAALAPTARTPGWNNRSPEIRQYELSGCTLYVVPYRRWAYRRQERLAAEWHRQREQG